MKDKQEDPEDIRIVVAEVPLAEMFGFINRLRALTKGRGTFTMQLSGYRPVPKHIEKEIIKKARGET